MGLCKKKASMAENDYKCLYKYLLWDACSVYVCMYKREGDLGVHSPPQGLSGQKCRTYFHFHYFTLISND